MKLRVQQFEIQHDESRASPSPVQGMRLVAVAAPK